MFKLIKNLIKKISFSYLIYEKWNFFLETVKAKKIQNANLKRVQRYSSCNRNESAVKNVVFVVIHKAVWKVDSVFKKMLSDDNFNPVILVAPYLPYGEDQMLIDMSDAFAYFKAKGYPVKNAYDEKGWLSVESDFKPDLIFFTNPHNLTMPNYYSRLFESYISYYVPYYHQISSWGDYRPQYNQLFHNAMWRIFSPHNVALDIHRQYSDNKGKNVTVTGYPAMEPFMDKNYLPISPWKKQDKNKLKIIWAPHHTIDMPHLPYANFLKYAEFFKNLVERYQDSIQWAFKPHPILKPKLINHPDWGQERTQEFWSFWENQPYCQLEEGEYVDLFLTSDAMIHDSGSFLAEYLYTNKPVLYLTSSKNMKEFFNLVGCEAFDACCHAFNVHDIEVFIDNLFSGNDPMQSQRQAFLEKHVLPFFINTTPSDRIIEIIKKDFGIL